MGAPRPAGHRGRAGSRAARRPVPAASAAGSLPGKSGSASLPAVRTAPAAGKTRGSASSGSGAERSVWQCPAWARARPNCNGQRGGISAGSAGDGGNGRGAGGGNPPTGDGASGGEGAQRARSAGQAAGDGRGAVERWASLSNDDRLERYKSYLAMDIRRKLTLATERKASMQATARARGSGLRPPIGQAGGGGGGRGEAVSGAGSAGPAFGNERPGSGRASGVVPKRRRGRRGRRGGRKVLRDEDGRPRRLVQGVLAFAQSSGVNAEGTASGEGKSEASRPPLAGQRFSQPDRRGHVRARSSSRPARPAQRPIGGRRQSPAAVQQHPYTGVRTAGAVAEDPPTAGRFSRGSRAKGNAAGIRHAKGRSGRNPA